MTCRRLKLNISCEAVIANFRIIGPIDENVFRLQVAMNYSMIVNMGEAFKDLSK